MNTNDSPLKEFLLEEYKNISNAHFNISQRVTTFFQYILVVYSAPLLVLTNKYTLRYEEYFGLIFLIISLIGFFILNYVSKLRCETLLYARTVNGIRKFFYDNYRDESNYILHYQVLPVQTEVPSYNDKGQFRWIENSLMVINIAYLYFGLIFLQKFTCKKLPIWCIVVISVLYFAIQVFYKFVSIRRQEAGLDFYEHIIGVDIDGVLNRHREYFCKILNKMINKNVDPESIIKIPVRKSNLGINEDDEVKVFSNIEYWSNMTEDVNAIKMINKLKNSMGYKIILFSYRPWGKGHFNIKKLTKKWLKDKGLSYDKLIIESGHELNPISWKKSLYKNRMYLSKKYKVKYFIEDDPDNALILSKICRYVFIVDQPYNRNSNLPCNVIRITNWEDLSTIIKTL